MTTTTVVNALRIIQYALSILYMNKDDIGKLTIAWLKVTKDEIDELIEEKEQ